MGRKKKKSLKPWCWYCNREFDDEKILIQHQKAKHFKCHLCYKKLYTGPGLAIHCMQVHKETIDKIPNALPNRGSTEVEVYGMEGIPEADLKAHHEHKLGKEEEPEAKKPAMDPRGVGMPQQPRFPYPMPGYPPMHIMPGMPPMMPPGMHPPFPPQPGGPPGPSSAAPPAATSQSQSSSSEGPKPTFPAYGGPGPTDSSASNGNDEHPQTSKPPATIVTRTATSQIMHPAEDISLEEQKASQSKYSYFGTGGNKTFPAPTPASSSGAPPPRPKPPQGMFPGPMFPVPGFGGMPMNAHMGMYGGMPMMPPRPMMPGSGGGPPPRF